MVAGPTALAVDAKPVGVGDSIPDAVVHSVDGKQLKLREMVKQSPTVLIFYRGGWCPYCTRHLQALAEVEGPLKQAGYQILAVSADQPAIIAKTPHRDQLGYQLLSDASMQAAKAFGITFKVADELVAKYKNEYQIDIETASGKTHHVLPHPAVFVVDTGGVVRFAYINKDYKVRLDPDKILEAAVAAKK